MDENVKERPILFSPEMVQAILDGRKTQTRRLSGLGDVNRYPGVLSGVTDLGELGYRGYLRSGYYLKPASRKQYVADPELFHWFLGMQPEGREINPIPVKCPFGKRGDRLWVREKCIIHQEPCEFDPEGVVYYAADFAPGATAESWTPSIHMPRWTSRITLEITGVRVERVRDISEDDAKAEGVGAWHDTINGTIYSGEFSLLWDKINAKRGWGWTVNPWVWVIEFRVVE